MTVAAPRFTLDPRLAPGPGLRALALGQLDHAIARLARGNERDVHEARKACKRVRALLRLARPGLPSYAKENARVRDAARALSALREADVLRATARSVGLSATIGAARASPARLRAATGRAVRLLRLERRAVAEWPADAVSRATLERAFLDGYRRARRKLRRARRKPRAAVLHEYRKQVKYHRYHCEALARLWPRLAPRSAALDALGDWLGRHHDLEMLALELERHPERFPREALPAATRRLAAEQRRLGQRALRAGARHFGGGASAWFAARVVP